MDFCKALRKARRSAPSDEARQAVDAVIAAHCAIAQAEGGGTGNGPPPDPNDP